MNSLPENWCIAHFADIADIQLGKMLDEAKNKGRPTPYLRNINVRWGSVDMANILTMPMTEHDRSKFSIQDGDVLVCEGGEPGRAAVWRSGPTSLKFQKAILRVRAAAAVTPEWLMHYLKLSSMNGTLESQFTGTTIKHLPRLALQKVSLPLAPAGEQRRIISKLDTLLSRTKTARDELARVPVMIEHYKQAILKKAFNGELTADWRGEAGELESARDLVARTPAPDQSRGGRAATKHVVEGTAGISINNPGTPVPGGWDWVSLRRIARQETGHTPSRSKPEWWGGDVCWIGIKDANLHHGRVIHSTIQKTNELGLANSSARLLPAGTVCFSRTASVGYVTIMGREMATSQDFATWTCTDALLPKYLMYGLMSEGEDVRRFGEGSTHTTIYFPEIRAFYIKLSPLREQEEIVSRIETAFAQIERLAQEARQASHLLSYLDKGVLTKAFRGELIPQDPNDEPAEELLERIRASRETEGPKASGRPAEGCVADEFLGEGVAVV